MISVKEKVYCDGCKRKTNHKVIENSGMPLQYTISGTPPFDHCYFVDKYSIIQCCGCDRIAFLNEYEGDDAFNWDIEGNLIQETVYYVYPEEPKIEQANLRPIEPRKFENVPDFIVDLYNEVINAYNTNASLLCAVGLRTIVEAICKDTNVLDGPKLDASGNPSVDREGKIIRSDTLAGRINGLCESGYITKKQAGVIHQVRELGNYAVHEIELPARRTVRIGIELISDLLHNIYELENIKLLPNK